MLQSKMLFASLLLLLSSCATIDVPDFKVHITLPASEDGFGISTVSREEITIPKEQWDVQKKRGIIILSKDYKILKRTIRKNCITNKCRVALGRLDNLFLAIDKALLAIPPGAK